MNKINKSKEWVPDAFEKFGEFEKKQKKMKYSKYYYI